jgi:hypothetical protein
LSDSLLLFSQKAVYLQRFEKHILKYETKYLGKDVAHGHVALVGDFGHLGRTCGLGYGTATGGTLRTRQR